MLGTKPIKTCPTAFNYALMDGLIIDGPGTDRNLMAHIAYLTTAYLDVGVWSEGKAVFPKGLPDLTGEAGRISEVRLALIYTESATAHRWPFLHGDGLRKCDLDRLYRDAGWTDQINKVLDDLGWPRRLSGTLSVVDTTTAVE